MREVYRDGPYGGINVGDALDRVVAEINQIGLDEFLRTR